MPGEPSRQEAGDEGGSGSGGCTVQDAVVLARQRSDAGAASSVVPLGCRCPRQRFAPFQRLYGDYLNRFRRHRSVSHAGSRTILDVISKLYRLGALPLHLRQLLSWLRSRRLPPRSRASLSRSERQRASSTEYDERCMLEPTSSCSPSSCRTDQPSPHRRQRTPRLPSNHRPQRLLPPSRRPLRATAPQPLPVTKTTTTQRRWTNRWRLAYVASSPRAATLAQSSKLCSSMLPPSPRRRW